MIKQLPFKGKLLISDMDGTLLDSNYEISSENKAALERFVEGGGLFTIATGRTAEGVRRYIRQLPVNLPVVVSNGAQVYDFRLDKVLWRSCLKDDIENVLADLLQNFPELGVEIYIDEGVCVVQKNHVTEWHRQKENILTGEFKLKDIPKPWYKIVLAWDNKSLKKVEAYLQGKTGTSRTVFAEEVFLDLLNVDTSKGAALEYLTQTFEVPFSEVIAIGDNLNDLEMIKMAGMGVAVENAHEGLKECARLCSCHHNDSAVACVIRWLDENIV